MFKKNKLTFGMLTCLAIAGITAQANAATYYLKHVSTGKYAKVDSSNDKIVLSASGTSSAQAFEKVSSSGGYTFKASGGSYNGKYSVEPSGAKRQEMTATSSSSAEVFTEHNCSDGGVYFTSNTTDANLKVESDLALGNSSGGTCSSSANKFEWVTTSSNSDFSLNPDAAPSENFDLSLWNLSIPVADSDGYATTIEVDDLNKEYQHSDYFKTADDGGMVFKAYVSGAKTSKSTTYTRSELREMLRGTDTKISTKGVNKNNWVFSGTDIDEQVDAGGVDGKLKATLKIDHVTDTGDSDQVGRVIIGQIHAPSNEPIRLYYRLLPGNDKGSIYFAHEPASGYGSEQCIEMIGSRSNSASNPSDGIAIGDVFSYEIDVDGDYITVTIKRDGKPDVVEDVNISGSGYFQDGMYQYFKAGVYLQDKTGSSNDYAQATFYSLEHSHD